MFFTRLIFILLGLWLLRQLFRIWSRPRGSAEDRAEQPRPASPKPSPLEDRNIREGDYEELKEEAEVERESS